MLNKSGKSECACLVPDLEGNTFSFSLLSMIFTVGLSYIALLCRSVFPLYPFYREFLIISEFCQKLLLHVVT